MAIIIDAYSLLTFLLCLTYKRRELDGMAVATAPGNIKKITISHFLFQKKCGYFCLEPRGSQ